MKFFCNGREWDTDAPVYVLGYCIKNWFAVDTRRKDNLHSPKCSASSVEKSGFQI